MASRHHKPKNVQEGTVEVIVTSAVTPTETTKYCKEMKEATTAMCVDNGCANLGFSGLMKKKLELSWISGTNNTQAN